MTGTESTIAGTESALGGGKAATTSGEPTMSGSDPNATVSPADTTAPPRPRRGGGPIGHLWRRVWGRNVEAAAQAAAVALSARQAADLRRAFAVRELAGASMMSTGRSEALATTLPALVGLAREAAFWSLSAGLPDPAPTDAADALARTPAALLAQLVPDEPARERVRAALAAPQGGAVWSRRTPEEQEQAFIEQAAPSTVLLERLTRPRRQLRKLRIRRVLMGLGGIALALAAQQITSALQFGSSLTAGHAWRASSTLDVCKPKEHWCADAVTDIFFCTTDENNPLKEYDLSEQKTNSRLVVKNRSDCCPDRAVPLILEVSADRTDWREVVRRDDPIATWGADFQATRARYARLRVARRSLLHLDRFDLYR